MNERARVNNACREECGAAWANVVHTMSSTASFDSGSSCATITLPHDDVTPCISSGNTPRCCCCCVVVCAAKEYTS